jgi:thiol-disulfide isomerase/thioredoxin
MGWINGPPPDASTLSGKVVVVEVWAHWCPPCRQAAPELVQTYRKFKDRDVQFVGLVSGGDDELPQTQAFIDRYKIPWPNGYGAEATIQSLGVNYIPATFVIGTDGRISWNNEMAGDLDREIEKALGKAKK